MEVQDVKIRVGLAFSAWFVFCLLLSLGSLGGIAYAIYWALTIAERAVGG